MAELFLSAFLSVLFDRLTSPELLRFASQEGVQAKLKKLEKTLRMIYGVLEDAEQKQLTIKDVQMWLDDLQDLAYDAEDILDEFVTEISQCKLMAGHDPDTTNKVLKLIPAYLNPCVIKFHVCLGSKIKDITNRLDELFKLGDVLGLKKISGEASATVWKRPPATCVPTEPVVYGRDEDKAKILKMMSTGGPSAVNFRVIPIVAMGGVGKTTLAREVYNDKMVQDFNLRAWVCVSDDFDVLRISKAILESISLSSCNLENLNAVQVKLTEEVTGRKFLLVLDDVWSNDYGLWETLKSPFLTGAPGSTIIVTTRSSEVALTMGPIEYYELKLLTDEDCWSVFMMHAFESRDVSAYGNLKLIRQKLVQKCRGMPLAARVLGGLLRSKPDDKWEDLLNSEIWDLSNESEIPAVLKLSYHHLPSHLKRCFAYCAIFPKDYELEEEELVLLWMAEGIIQELKGSKQLEDLGGEYFQELLSRSLFQQSSTNGSKFIMHDLVNDLAQWASGETSFRLEDVLLGKRRLTQFKMVRYSSYTGDFCDGNVKFDILHKVKRLRTFLHAPLDSDPSHNQYGSF